MKTLVIVLGQVRSAGITAESWDRHFLRVLRRDGDAAVALCHCAGYHEQDPYFHRIADYVWTLPEPASLSAVYNDEAVRLGVAKPEAWTRLLDIPGNWLGEIDESTGKRPGSAARIWMLKNHALRMIREHAMDGYFDRCVVTRSDFFYVADHPSLNALQPQFVWAQRGQGYGGVPDRHAVVAMKDIACVLDWLNPMLLYPSQLRRLMLQGCMSWNAESYMKLMLIWHRRHHRLRRFPNTFFLVRSDAAATTWAEGTFDPALGFRVKYPDEKTAAQQNAIRLAACGYAASEIRRQSWAETVDSLGHAISPAMLPLTRGIRDCLRPIVRGCLRRI